MAKRTIMSVGIDVPHPDVENVHIETKRSLLDGDIIFFRPELYLYPYEDLQGKHCLTDARSFQIKEVMSHWRQQILAAFDAGKTIIIMLSRYQDFFVDSGQRSYSGTGRNRITTRHVEPSNNYSMTPVGFKSITNATGERVAREQKITPIEYYWDTLGQDSNYVVYFESEKVRPLLKTADRTRFVAAYARGKGHLVLVPNLNIDFGQFYDEPDNGDELAINKEGKKFGSKIMGALVAVDNEAHASEAITEPPRMVKERRVSVVGRAQTRAKAVGNFA